MQYSDNYIPSITPYFEPETTTFYLPGWVPIPGFKLVKDTQSKRFSLIDTQNNITVYTVILHPYCGKKIGNKPRVLVDIKQTTKPGYCEVIRQFPYALFFTYFLSKYTIVLTSGAQSVESYRFWFRRISWALSANYQVYISNDKTKGPLFYRIPDWPIFFEVWLEFCRGQMNGQHINKIMVITTEGE